MANVNAPRGLVYKYCLHGGDPLLMTCIIPSGDNTATFVNDPVKIETTSAGEGNKFMCVAQAGATDAFVGVVKSFDQVRGIALSSSNLNRLHRPASTAMYCTVIVDPEAVFEITADDVAATIATSDIGNNAPVTLGSGSTATGMSTAQLDSSLIANTATLPMKIIGFTQSDDNTVGSANAKVLVTINNHQLKGGTGTQTS